MDRLVSALSAFIRIASNGTAPGHRLYLWCPGCNDLHGVTIEHPDGWTWDGNIAAPTITPNILVHSHKTFDANGEVVDTPLCHSYVKDGQWEFLLNSTHPLAGQTVPMVELPQKYDNEYFGEK